MMPFLGSLLAFKVRLMMMVMMMMMMMMVFYDAVPGGQPSGFQGAPDAWCCAPWLQR